MLSAQALEFRRDKITSTDARIIMNARSDQELLEHYQRKIGELPPIEQTFRDAAGLGGGARHHR